MDYFCEIISHAEVVVFDDCGHFISHDKAEEAVKSLINFVDRHSNPKVKHSENMLINWIFSVVIFCLFLFLYLHI